MMALLRLLPFLGIGAAVAYHFITVDSLNDTIESQKSEITELNQEVGTLRAAQATNLSTIDALEQDIQRQNREITRLETSRNEIASERDRYLSIFRDHDLTNLALRRPGLIEPLINRGTSDVFDQLEQETEEQRQRYENPNSQPDGTDS